MSYLGSVLVRHLRQIHWFLFFVFDLLPRGFLIIILSEQNQIRGFPIAFTSIIIVVGYFNFVLFISRVYIDPSVFIAALFIPIAIYGNFVLFIF